MSRRDRWEGTQLVSILSAFLKRVRGYERKFANRRDLTRRDLTDAVIRLHHRRLATQPASAVPAYRPMSATSASSSAPVDRPEMSGRT
jgi:hypothetical protein